MADCTTVSKYVYSIKKSFFLYFLLVSFTHSLLFAVTTLFASSALAQDYWAAAESDDAHETYRPGGPRGKMGKGPKGPMPHELLRMHADRLNLSEDVLNEVAQFKKSMDILKEIEHYGNERVLPPGKALEVLKEMGLNGNERVFDVHKEVLIQ